MGDQLRKNPIFRWAEECTVDTHPTEDDQWKHATGGIHPECHGAGCHQENFDNFDGDDDRSLTDTIGEGAADEREEHQRQREDDKSGGGLGLSDGF